jgi:hypothetical protein
MKFNIDSLLKDTNVLYVVLFMAVTNLMGYLLVRNLDAVVFFLVTGFLTSYFSKNMIIVMLTAMIATSILVGSHYVSNAKEGFEDGEDKKKTCPDGEKMDKGKCVAVQAAPSTKPAKATKATPAGFDNPAPAPAELDEAEATGQKPKIDYASTLEQAYDNLDKLLGSDAIRSMTDDTQKLAGKQAQLMGNIKKMEPMMQKAGAMLEGMDMEKLTGMMGGVSAMVEKMGGMGKLLG